MSQSYDPKDEYSLEIEDYDWGYCTCKNDIDKNNEYSCHFQVICGCVLYFSEEEIEANGGYKNCTINVTLDPSYHWRKDHWNPDCFVTMLMAEGKRLANKLKQKSFTNNTDNTENVVKNNENSNTINIKGIVTMSDDDVDLDLFS